MRGGWEGRGCEKGGGCERMRMLDGGGLVPCGYISGVGSLGLGAVRRI